MPSRRVPPGDRRRALPSPGPRRPALPTSVDGLRALFDALPVAIAVARASDGTVLYANGRLAALLGVPVERLLGGPLDEVCPEAGAHRAIVGAVPRDGGVRELELGVRRPDGTPLWVVAAVSRVLIADEPEVLLIALGDPTERRRRERGLDEPAVTLAELAEFPERNPAPVCRLDRAGTVLLANPAARELFGENGLLGRSWLDLCPGVDRDVWNRVLESDGPLAHEAEIGDMCVVFTHVRSDSGAFVFAFGADVTASRRDARLLAERAAALAEVARFPEMNPGPVARLELDGTVVMANAAARGVFGDALVGRSWRETCPGVDEAVWRDILAATGPVPLEARVGEREYVFAHRRDLEGHLVFVYGADVTHQKRAERALRQADRMATLGTLAAGVAHELNNPAAATGRAAEQLRDAFARLEDSRLRLGDVALTAAGQQMLRALERQGRERAARPSDLDSLTRSDQEAAVEAWLEDHGVEDPWDAAPSLVAQGLDAPALSGLAEALDEQALSAVLAWAASAFPVYALLHEIGQGSARISEIVGALKSYSYLGQAPVQSVDLHEGLDNTLVILRNKLKVGIQVHRDYGPDVPALPAYGSELNQVWTNLLDNAADAMGGEGEITIRTRRHDGWAVIEIEDDGPGIPESVRSQVFDPFFTTKAPGQGTGLGLSTSYAIVTEKHRGEISVESRPGFTRFTVRLPLEPPPAATPSAGDLQPTPGRLGDAGVHVLPRQP